MAFDTVFSTVFSQAFIVSILFSFIPWFYYIRKKKVNIMKNSMTAFVIWTIAISICVTLVFAVVPTFCYLLCGDFSNTPWAVLVDYQPRFFAFIGSLFMLMIAINGFFRGKLTL